MLERTIAGLPPDPIGGFFRVAGDSDLVRYAAAERGPDACYRRFAGPP
jgi:hypothetical protein